MAGRSVNIEKAIQVNPASGWVRGPVWCIENNRLLGMVTLDIKSWDELDTVLDAVRAVRDGYTSKIRKPDGSLPL